MEQKEVKLIGIRAENHGIIKAAVLTPDILSKRLVTLTGIEGNGKSTLLDMMKTAVSGTDAIRKKDILEDGYIAEAQLTDGEVSLFIGAKVTSYTRGEKAGEPKFETMLYAKDANGKKYTPLIDGAQPTAADYTKMLTTELTFAMPDLFSENQTTHRQFIEKLFSEELEKLGADAVVERISKLRKVRDNARAMCQANGAFMEGLKAEGWTEKTLEMLPPIDEQKLEESIYNKKIERDRILNATSKDIELAKEKLTNERMTALQKIKDEGAVVRKEMDDKFANDTKIYLDAKSANEANERAIKDIITLTQETVHKVNVLFQGKFNAETIVNQINEGSEKLIQEYKDMLVDIKEPEQDILLHQKISKLVGEYKELESKPLNIPDFQAPDTTELDNEIESLIEQKNGAKSTNAILHRYSLNREWVKANGEYLAELDILRKMYASINCGVEGMNIIPRETNSGKIEVWIQYDGEYDTEFFKNPNKESRMMFEYSSFQRTVIGLMLQAARLNLKKKALRLAFVDDVAFTENGINILRDIAERLNLQLVVAWTHEVEKDSLREGEVAVIGGEIFFK